MGFDTYRYYEGNDKLRAWICIPLTVNIFDRKQGTIDALFSPELWTEDGLASQSGDKTFWDRSTLYALRGVFAAGDTKRGLNICNITRTAGCWVSMSPTLLKPIPKEASVTFRPKAVYIAGFTPRVFRDPSHSAQFFTVTPQLPDGWDYMRIKNVHGFVKNMTLKC